MQDTIGSPSQQTVQPGPVNLANTRMLDDFGTDDPNLPEDFGTEDTMSVTATPMIMAVSDTRQLQFQAVATIRTTLSSSCL